MSAVKLESILNRKRTFVYLISPLEGLWDTYDNSKFDVTRRR